MIGLFLKPSEQPLPHRKVQHRSRPNSHDNMHSGILVLCMMRYKIGGPARRTTILAAYFVHTCPGLCAPLPRWQKHLRRMSPASSHDKAHKAGKRQSLGTIGTAHKSSDLHVPTFRIRCGRTATQSHPCGASTFQNTLRLCRIKRTALL